MIGQNPPWLDTLENHGLAIVGVIFSVYCFAWLGKRIFGKEGYTDRYIQATETLVGSLREHLGASDTNLEKITSVSAKVCEVCEKLDRNQEEMCGVVRGLVGNCETTHHQILGDLTDQTAAIQKKIDAMHKHFTESTQHHEQQDRIVAAIDGCIDVLEIVCPDRSSALELLRKALKGNP